MTAILSGEGPTSGAFRWPDVPEDLTPWDKEAFEASEGEQEERKKEYNVQESQGRFFDEEKRGFRQWDGGVGRVGEGREKLAEMARRLREGRERWRIGEEGM